MTRLLLAAALTLAPFCARSAEFAAAQECGARGVYHYEMFEFQKSEEVFKQCLSMQPQNTDFMMSLGGVLLMQEKYKEAKRYFEKTAAALPKNSPYSAYIYSRLGDIAVKEGNYAAAGEYYDKSISYNKSNVNSIIGKGVILQEQGNIAGAAEMYRLALDLSPHEVIARDRLRALEPVIFSDEQILNALKERKAVDPKQTALTPENRVLFENIHRAELRGGVEFLLNERPNIGERFVIIQNKDNSSYRALLTLDGFLRSEQLRAEKAREKFGAFPGINPLTVQQLRSLDGSPIFTPEGFLTEEGRYAYEQAEQDKMAFLLPGEKPRAADKELRAKIDAHIKKIEGMGYMRITEKEFEYLSLATKCSPATFKKDMKMFFWRTPVKEQISFAYVPSMPETVAYEQNGLTCATQRVFPYMRVQELREHWTENDSVPTEDGAAAWCTERGLSRCRL